MIYLDKPNSDGQWWVELNCPNHGLILKLVTVKTDSDDYVQKTTCCVQGQDTWIHMYNDMFNKSKWIKFEGIIPKFDGDEILSLQQQ